MVFDKALAAESMKMEVDRAMDVMYDVEQQIPKKYFEECHGIVMITVVEVGLLVSGSKGSGLLIGRITNDDDDNKSKSWSPPVAISYSGMGVGLVVGKETKAMIIFLMTEEALTTFSSSVHIQLGSQAAATVGDKNKEKDHTLHATGKGVMHTAAFTHSKGAFVGVSLESAIIKLDTKRHHDLYGPNVPVEEILHGGAVKDTRTDFKQLQDHLEKIIAK